jgi:uncharacterized alkaline shock family protein YloU
MHKEESRTDLGTIRIHRNVIASIAALAAGEIEGVKRVGGDFKSGLLQMVGQKPLAAIRVEFNKNEEVEVDVPLVIKFGHNIPDIANKVQENVRANIEKMTSLSVKDINVNIQSIERG